MSLAKKPTLLVAALILSTTGGCLTSRLRSNTICQMQTVHDIQQQQVLDNLAMFVHDNHAYPYFSLVSAGTSQMTNTSTLSGTNTWSRVSGAFLFTTLGVNPQQQCQAMGNWQINPINDSVKLTVMRCIYQRAVAGCCGTPIPTDCPDCSKMFQYYYPWEKPANTEAVQAEAAPKQPILQGMITPNCIPTDRCWFHYGCKKDVPPNCDCMPVGCYCGTYVWVTPEGRDELSKLTLLILDVAYYDPPGKPETSAEGAGTFIRTPSPQPFTELGVARTIQAFTPQVVAPPPNPSPSP